VDTDILASGKKRKRERTNYSEKEMLKDFDLAIGKYASYDDDNDNNSVASEYSDAPDNSSDEEEALDSFENEELKMIVKDAKSSHKKNDERHQWGGVSSTDWTKNGKAKQECVLYCIFISSLFFIVIYCNADVEQILRCLQMYGYGNIEWDQLFKKAMPLSKAHKPEELR
jgi:hypothetical protein